MSLPSPPESVLFFANAKYENVTTLINFLTGYCRSLLITDDWNRALELVAGNAVALALVDVKDTDFHLIQPLKQASKNADIALVALVDKADFAYRSRLVTAGFDDCLTSSNNLTLLGELLALWHIPGKSPTASDYFAALLTACNNNQKLALSLFEKLFGECTQQLAAIEAALSNDDFLEARFITHKLHGSMAVCQFSDIKILANKLESCLSQGRFDQCELHYFALRQSVENLLQCEAAILSYFQTHGE